MMTTKPWLHINMVDRDDTRKPSDCEHEVPEYHERHEDTKQLHWNDMVDIVGRKRSTRGEACDEHGREHPANKSSSAGGL